MAEEALEWITDLLNEFDIPYQIQGGLAAKVYGSKRDLADIDIDIPRIGFDQISERVKQYITYGPAFYKDNHWDIFLMTLATDFSDPCFIEIMGVRVPAIPRNKLIVYKKILSRKVDWQDIQEVEVIESQTKG